MSLTKETNRVYAALTGTVVGGKGHGISHRWDGTVLTVSSDSGTSSADLQGAGAKTVVTVTEIGDGSYAADMTFPQVTAAIAAGDAVAVEWHPNGNTVYVLPLLVHEASAVYFQGDFLGTASVYFRLNSDNTVEKLEFPYEPHRDVTAVSVSKSDLTQTDDNWYGYYYITVDSTYADGGTDQVVITLDHTEKPISVTRNGVECTLTWEGF